MGVGVLSISKYTMYSFILNKNSKSPILESFFEDFFQTDIFIFELRKPAFLKSS